MATTENDDHLIECDRCHKRSTPMDFAYIGPEDERDNRCTPFMDWKQICFGCATQVEMERWYGGDGPGKGTKDN